MKRLKLKYYSKPETYQGRTKAASVVGEGRPVIKRATMKGSVHYTTPRMSDTIHGNKMVLDWDQLTLLMRKQK